MLWAWEALQESLCRVCGRPKAAHDDDSPSDYHTGFDECTAMKALDAAQARRGEDHKQAHEQGLRPERAESWTTWTDAEGEPKS